MSPRVKPFSALSIVGLLFLLSGPLTGQDRLPPFALARLGPLRLRHPDIVCALAFDPNGKTLFSAGGDKVIRRWDLTTFKEIDGLPGHTEEVRGLAVTPDGKHVLSCALERGIRHWYLDGKDKKHDLFEDHKDGVEGLALSPDGKSFASVGRDQSVIVWQLENAERQILVGHENSVTCVAYHPTLKLLATGSWDKTIRLWDLETGKLKTTRRGHTDYVESLAWSPDGKQLASGSKDGTIRLWDINGKVTQKLEGKLSRVWSLTYSRDGKLLFAGGESIVGSRETFFAFDAATGKDVWKQAAHLPGLIPTPYSEFRTSIRGTACIVLSPDGKSLATSGADGRIRLWNAATGRDLLPPQGHDDHLTGVVGLQDGTTVVSASLDGTLRWWDTKAGKETRRNEVPDGAITSLSLSSDGKRLFAAGLKSKVGIWEAETGKKIDDFRGPDKSARRTAISPEGAILAVAYSTDMGSTLILWDTATRKEIRRLEGLETNVLSLAFSADGKHLAAVSHEGPVRRWDVASGKPLPPLKHALRGATALAYSPDGRFLAVGFGMHRTVVLWDAVTGAHLQEFYPVGSAVAALAFSPDSATLASAHADGKAILWEASTGKERRRIEGHLGSLTTLSFSADGKRLLTGATDQTAMVWDRLATDTTFPRLEDKQAQLWRDMASEEADRAYDAVCILARNHEEATGFLKPRVQPSPKVDTEQIKRWIANLDARAFKVRQEAMENLTRQGRLAERFLKDALGGNAPLEVKKRIEELLKRMSGEEPIDDGQRLLRALEALELIGNEKAREVVQIVADGGDSEAKRVARAALDRMKRRSP